MDDAEKDAGFFSGLGSGAGFIIGKTIGFALLLGVAYLYSLFAGPILTDTDTDTAAVKLVDATLFDLGMTVFIGALFGCLIGR